jgi:hypothetical protein
MTMKTLLLTALLLTATLIVGAPSASAEDPVQCDTDPSDGFVYCRVPAAHACAWANLDPSRPRYCVG